MQRVLYFIGIQFIFIYSSTIAQSLKIYISIFVELIDRDCAIKTVRSKKSATEAALATFRDGSNFSQSLALVPLLPRNMISLWQTLCTKLSLFPPWLLNQEREVRDGGWGRGAHSQTHTHTDRHTHTYKHSTHTQTHSHLSTSLCHFAALARLLETPQSDHPLPYLTLALLLPSNLRLMIGSYPPAASPRSPGRRGVPSSDPPLVLREGNHQRFLFAWSVPIYLILSLSLFLSSSSFSLSLHYRLSLTLG